MMKKIIGGNNFESTNSSNSIAGKLRMPASAAQSRGLPAVAPVYRVPVDRKRYNYLSYYPEEKKPTRCFFPSLNIGNPPSVVRKIRLPETKIPTEKSAVKRSLPFTDYLQPNTPKKRCTKVEQNHQEIIGPASTYCFTYVYDKWPEPKGFNPESSVFL